MKLVSRIFDRSDSNAVEKDMGKDSRERVEITVTKEIVYAYTEHVAVARYVSGREREWTFDTMVTAKEGIILKNYVDENVYTHLDRDTPLQKLMPPDIKPAGAKAFATIPLANLEDFETTERIEKERTEMFRASATVPRPTADDVVDEIERYVDAVSVKEVDEQ